MRKPALSVLFLILSAPFITHAQAVDDHTAGGCGPSKSGFDVKTNDKQRPLPAAPPDGKALVYVVQTVWEQPGLVIGSQKATTRVGIDGAWVGANHGNSYFYFSIDPGPHSICTDWQSTFYERSGLASAADLNAQAGTVYYFRVKVRDSSQQRPGEVKIEPVDHSEWNLLYGSSSYSVSHPKK
jgi:Protein of unknown function (DUF2846)